MKYLIFLLATISLTAAEFNIFSLYGIRIEKPNHKEAPEEIQLVPIFQGNYNNDKEKVDLSSEPVLILDSNNSAITDSNVIEKLEAAQVNPPVLESQSTEYLSENKDKTALPEEGTQKLISEQSVSIVDETSNSELVASDSLQNQPKAESSEAAAPQDEGSASNFSVSEKTSSDLGNEKSEPEVTKSETVSKEEELTNLKDNSNTAPESNISGITNNFSGESEEKNNDVNASTLLTVTTENTSSQTLDTSLSSDDSKDKTEKLINENLNLNENTVSPTSDNSLINNYISSNKVFENESKQNTAAYTNSQTTEAVFVTEQTNKIEPTVLSSQLDTSARPEEIATATEVLINGQKEPIDDKKPTLAPNSITFDVVTEQSESKQSLNENNQSQLIAILTQPTLPEALSAIVSEKEKTLTESRFTEVTTTVPATQSFGVKTIAIDDSQSYLLKFFSPWTKDNQASGEKSPSTSIRVSSDKDVPVRFLTHSKFISVGQLTN